MKKQHTVTCRLKTMERSVVGFCVKVDGHLTFLACPYCYAHLCQSHQRFNGVGALQESLETDSSSSSEIDQLEDAVVFAQLKSIVGSSYAQINVTKDMWVSCSSFRELNEAIANGRIFGKVIHFKRLADELFWDCPSGLAVVNLDRENLFLFRSGREPTSMALSSALSYLRRWAGMGLVMFEQDNIAFLESHFYQGSVRSSVRRLMRMAVESWS